jgi:hypothetical protein
MKEEEGEDSGNEGDYEEYYQTEEYYQREDNEPPREKVKSKRWDQLYELVFLNLTAEQTPKRDQRVHAESLGGRKGRRPGVHLPPEN